MASKPFVPYIVRQGDYLTALAYRYGFQAAEVWDHPKNADLKAARTHHDTLCPGDLLFIPKPEVRALDLHQGQPNEYAGEPPLVDVVLRYGDTKGAWANEPYEVEGLHEPTKGSLDGQGKVTLKVPVTTKTLGIRFPRKEHEENLLIGGLDPVDVWSGAQQRLLALGWYHGSFTGKKDRQTQAALRSFQGASDLPTSGELDEATVEALQDAYDLGSKA